MAKSLEMLMENKILERQQLQITILVTLKLKNCQAKK
jgi:hypothetical protein